MNLTLGPPQYVLKNGETLRFMPLGMDGDTRSIDPKDITEEIQRDIDKEDLKVIITEKEKVVIEKKSLKSDLK